MDETFVITLPFLMEAKASEHGCKWPVPKWLVDALFLDATRKVDQEQRAWQTYAHMKRTGTLSR
jgi:hypothetical protein